MYEPSLVNGSARYRVSIAVQYEQSSAGDAVRTEYLRLDLGGAKRGRYVLTLELKDLNSNAIVTRTRDLVLVERYARVVAIAYTCCAGFLPCTLS